MKKLKSKFEITAIGKRYFYNGILIGLFYGFLINSLLHLLIRTKDLTYAFADNNWNRFLQSDISFYYSFLIGLLAASLGFCFTTYVWMSNIKWENKKERLKAHFAQTNAIFTFALVLFVLSRFFQIYFQFNFEEFNLHLKNEYRLLLYFLPLFIFMNNWIYISRIYESQKALLISVIIFIVIGLIFSFTET